MKTRGPVMLVVLDGFGIGDGGAGDAVARAHTPFLDRARAQWPTAKLSTSGAAVGLPEGQMGNSEVGHMTLGAGRIIDQDITRISRFFEEHGASGNAVLRDAIEAPAREGGRLHLLGLVSDGGVHSHQQHLEALCAACAELGASPVFHAFLDGRDTPPKSAARYLEALQASLDTCGGRIASVSGRYFAMDRDGRWERVQRVFDALVRGEAKWRAADAMSALRESYERGAGDEFVEPTLVEGGARIQEGDSVIFANFRADRARQLSAVLSGQCPERYAQHPGFAAAPKPARFVCMTEYDAAFDLPAAFPTPRHEQILGELLAAENRPQLRMAETEKYAHVTFFFNGGRETPFPGEERVLIPSPRDVATYDHKPEMSAPLLTRRLLQELEQKPYAFVLVNFANPDMVGHTGVLPAAVRAVESVDACLAEIVEQVLGQGGEVLITADHGNCEQMIDPAQGGPHTAHTTNPVPILWASADTGGRRLESGSLSDVAPTLLELLGMPKPALMTGRSLVVRE